MTVEGEEDVAQYAALLEQQAQAQTDMRTILTRPRYALPFLQPGRLVSVLTQPDPLAAAASTAEANPDTASERVLCLLSTSVASMGIHQLIQLTLFA